MDGSGVSGPVWIPSEAPGLAEYLAPNLQPVPLIPALAAAALVLYLAGVVRLAVLGRKWPVTRLLAFTAGCLALMVVMGAGIEGYGLEMFSVFMFQQLTLMMAIPPLLVYGSAGTLLLRATPHRGAGSAVLRAALGGLRSGWARLVLHPGFMIPLFLFSFYGVYFSGIANTLLRTWAGHTGLELLFLAAGILFTVPLISRDPLPRRQTHFGRVIDMFSEMPLHAFFGVVVMMATTPMVRFFTDPPPAWGVDPLKDQQTAGALAWSYGELPSVLLLLLILVRWQRDDTAAARREDRRSATEGTPELDAYNAYLRTLSERRFR